jgi:hypothetical protein
MEHIYYSLKQVFNTVGTIFLLLNTMCLLDNKLVRPGSCGESKPGTHTNEQVTGGYRCTSSLQNKGIKMENMIFSSLIYYFLKLSDLICYTFK